MRGRFFNMNQKSNKGLNIRKASTGLLTVVMITAMFLIAGCGGSSTLQQYMEANQEQMEEFKEVIEEITQQTSRMFAVEMSSFLEFVGDYEMVTNFQFHDPLFEAGTDVGDTIASELGRFFETESEFWYITAREIREDIGIDKFYYTMRYLDHEGNVLIERTFTGH